MSTEEERRKRAEYMRKYRTGSGEPSKRGRGINPDLDRSKPVGIDVEKDRNGYMRQYMRWKRSKD